MKQLINAFADLLTAATESGGELATTAQFALDHVNWKDSPNMPEPMCPPVVEAQMKSACARSGQDGSTSHRLAQALLAVTDQLQWQPYTSNFENEPDVAAFLPNFSVLNILGASGLLLSDRVDAGFSLQGRDTYYPTHAHLAEESYWIIGGDGDWKVDTQPWFPVQPGDSIYHQPWARHTMQTNEQALLSVWLWTSDLDSEVLFVRDYSDFMRTVKVAP